MCVCVCVCVFLSEKFCLFKKLEFILRISVIHHQIPYYQVAIRNREPKAEPGGSKEHEEVKSEAGSNQNRGDGSSQQVMGWTALTRLV